MHLVLDHISKSYPNPSGHGSNTVLQDISLEVTRGQSVAIVGPSGSGKSTLLNIIGALDKPDSGTITFEGTDLSTLDDSKLARVRNREMGFVFQLHHLLPQCNVIENVLIPTIPFGAKNESETCKNRAQQLLKRIGLENHLYHFPAQLSGGEQQRVAVARALMNKPKLILADEPTGSLDRSSSEKLGRLLIELNREQGITLIVVTHALGLARKMDRQFTLQNGVLKSS